MVQNPPASAGVISDMSLIPVLGRCLEKEMATHSRILAWNCPRMEEPGRLQSVASQRVEHDRVTSLSFTSSHDLYGL